MSKNRLDYRAQLSRHTHDVSAGYSSSLTTGPIVPQYYHVLNPGDTLYFDVHMFTRMQDVVTAFLGEVDVHLDAFFVPLQMLYTPFGQIYSQTDDFISSKFDLANIVSDRLQDFPVIPLDSAIASRSMSSEPTTYVPSECWGKACFRLLDALGCNPLGVCSQASRTVSEYTGDAIDDAYCHNPNISPWLFAAYQAIYQKFFRNDELERLKVYTFNFDTAFGSQVISSNAASFITLRYCQRPQDYFTRVRVSPIASAVNSIYNNNDWSSDGGSLNSLLNKVDSFLTSKDSSFGFQLFGRSSGTSSDTAFTSLSHYASARELGANESNSLNTANIRALFAVDKFSRIYGRADKTYDDQILAHFGIKIPHDVKHDATRIKSWRFGIGSEPIYGTNNNTYLDASGNETNSSVIGQVGGQAQGMFNSNQEKFTAPVHGVFMIVAYALTKPRYCNTFDKLNLLTDRLSFPIAEFDKLGAQPLYKFEVTPYFLQSDKRGQFLGWQNRYAQFKEKYNRISYTFASQETHYDDQSANVYAPWLLSRPVFSGLSNAVDILDGQNSHFPSYELFQENVNALNIVMRRMYTSGFATNYFSHPHMILQSDPLITEFMCNAKLVSWMSETGEPDL